MKIEVNGAGALVVKEIYNIVQLRTDKEFLNICMRDGGFEITYGKDNYEAKNGRITKVI